MLGTTSRAPQAGFSLIELMVGLVLGMIAVIIMMQVLRVSEGYKRTTTGGDSAQNNGAIALYGLQRDVRHAGHGLNTRMVIGCNVAVPAGHTVNTMAPVVVNPAGVPAGDSNTDTLMVFYGLTNDSSEGDRVEAQPSQQVYTLASFLASGGTPSFSVGDLVVAQQAARSSPCNLRMEAVTAVNNSNVTVATGLSGATGGALFNLGAAPRALVYAVRGGALTVCDYLVNDCGGALNPAHWVPVASNIVSLRAEYGRDSSAAMNGTVDVFDQTGPTTDCTWLRVRALRLVLVARSAQLERDNVTLAAPGWAGSGTTPINLSSDADWQRYRYKVFETTVPLRSMAWMEPDSTC